MFASFALVLLLGPPHALAQAGGGRANRANRDPAQFAARMMERYRELLEVKGDDEWKVIQERIDKVLQAQRELRLGGSGFARRGGNNGGNPPDGASQDANRRNRGGRGNVEPHPDADALQKALDAKASPQELKARLAKLRDLLKQREAKLAKAQEDLRSVLSVRQEAIAVLAGLLR